MKFLKVTTKYFDRSTNETKIHDFKTFINVDHIVSIINERDGANIFTTTDRIYVQESAEQLLEQCK